MRCGRQTSLSPYLSISPFRIERSKNCCERLLRRLRCAHREERGASSPFLHNNKITLSKQRFDIHRYACGWNKFSRSSKGWKIKRPVKRDVYEINCKWSGRNIRGKRGLFPWNVNEWNGKVSLEENFIRKKSDSWIGKLRESFYLINQLLKEFFFKRFLKNVCIYFGMQD